MNRQQTPGAEESLLARAIRLSAPVSEEDNLIRSVHPLDDKAEWMRAPTYNAPSEVDLKRAQREVDSIVGLTRDNQPQMVVVWNGDTSYWEEYFMSWNAAGQPDAPATKRPLVRYKALRNDVGKLVRDVFPPRFLLLSRIEPEQFAHVWKQDSYVFAPEINRLKQIRPDEPPKAMWLWYSTIARHTAYCCSTAAKNKERCFGTYAPPSYAFAALGEQVKATKKSGLSNNPFAEIDGSFIKHIADENTGYRGELMNLQIERQIYIENPLALLGVHASLKAEITPKGATQIVKDHYDRRIEDAAKLV